MLKRKEILEAMDVFEFCHWKRSDEEVSWTTPASIPVRRASENHLQIAEFKNSLTGYGKN